MANFPSSFRGWNFGDGLKWHFGQHGKLRTDFFGTTLSAAIRHGKVPLSVCSNSISALAIVPRRPAYISTCPGLCLLSLHYLPLPMPRLSAEPHRSRVPYKAMIQVFRVDKPTGDCTLLVVGRRARPLPSSSACTRSIEGCESTTGQPGKTMHCALRVEELSGDLTRKVDGESAGAFCNCAAGASAGNRR
jgi:hypothetical protein